MNELPGTACLIMYFERVPKLKKSSCIILIVEKDCYRGFDGVDVIIIGIDDLLAYYIMLDVAECLVAGHEVVPRYQLDLIDFKQTIGVKLFLPSRGVVKFVDPLMMFIITDPGGVRDGK